MRSLLAYTQNIIRFAFKFWEKPRPSFRGCLLMFRTRRVVEVLCFVLPPQEQSALSAS